MSTDPTIKKTGRPGSDEPAREVLVMVAFKADAATLAAIEKLKAAVEPDVVQPKSVAIRRALIAAANLLPEVPIDHPRKR